MRFVNVVALRFLQFFRFIGISFINRFITLLELKEKCERKRFDFVEESLTTSAKENGLIPLNKEWYFEKTREHENEDVFIYGVNSDEKAFLLKVRRRLHANNRCLVIVNLCFKDGDYFYEFNGSDLNKNTSTTRYEVNGFSLQLLSPFRRWRICFTGNLKRTDINTNEEKNVFASIRMLWYSLSAVFDLQTDNHISLISQTVKDCDLNDEHFFEDRYEQYGQLKGTVQFETDEPDTVILWGNKCKTVFDKNSKHSSNVRRLYGFVKDGIGFHYGILKYDTSGKRYSYGHFYTGVNVIFPIEKVESLSHEFDSLLKNEKTSIKMMSEGPRIVTANIDAAVKSCEWFSIHKLEINGFNGLSVFIDEVSGEKEEMSIYNQLRHFDRYKIAVTEKELSNNLVMSIGDPNSINSEISGGKGMSLSQLTVLLEEKEVKDKFNYTVPQGVIVTTNAYKEYLRENKEVKEAIESLQQTVWSEKSESVDQECTKVMNIINQSKLPKSVENKIKDKLNYVFKTNETEVEQKLFSVRSSATGEDGEEMSAAGQMTTFLGVKGMTNIYDSVVRCFASQFTRIAVEYRHGYGQLIDNTMAVVIQEMVDCEVAGVLFTCNPVNGDQRNIVITANYGLCESVVSAKSEPDTITLSVDQHSENVLSVQSVTVGSKKCVIKLDSEGGTIEQTSDSDSQQACCLNDNYAIKLGQIGVFLSKCFGNARDIEWGIKSEQIFVLQSRPITNLNKFSEWEVMHEMDSSIASEFDVLTRANVGEVMPGSMSHLAHTFSFAAWDLPGYINERKTNYLPDRKYCPFNMKFFAVVCNQFFFNLRHRIFNTLITEEEPTVLNKGMQFSMFGHEVHINGFTHPSVEKTVKTSIFFKIKVVYLLLELVINCVKRLRKTSKLYEEIDFFKGDFKTSEELFDFISKSVTKLYEPLARHKECTFGSSVWNIFLMAVLTKGKKDFTPEMLVDISNLLAENKNILSVEVPKILRDIAESIEDKEEFQKMTETEALNYLTNGKTKASVKFNQFLKTHGHRGYKEFDPVAIQWVDDPSPLLKSLKAKLSTNFAAVEDKKEMTIDEIVENLKTELTGTQKFIIRKILLPYARNGVSAREESKSLLIKTLHQYRVGFWKLARIMCYKEGRLPEPDLLFFLKYEEIDRLIKERDPSLVSKAKQRKRIFKIMNEYKFDEIAMGPDFQPRNPNKVTVEVDSTWPQLKGTPVYVGKVKGRAFVAHTFEDVNDIQSGDILITYSTDIAWSPYFPMLSGIATEIGGLVSHGAVIAREFGLPSIVGVDGATAVFKTGDTILLDSEKGIIVKIQS